MADIIQIRRDSAADWTSVNPTLAQGEIGFETDTGKIKIGDGATAWVGLLYFTVSGFQPLDADLTDLATKWAAASASAQASLQFHEDTDNGTNKITVQGPASIGSDVVVTLPVATDTLVGKATTDTLTNKRITKRVSTEASSATPTINTDNVDCHRITALTVAITSMTTNLSGTPTDSQMLMISITGTAARAITWGASFAAGAVALPTTTITTQRLDVGFKWSTVASKWMCMASGSYADA